VKEVTTMRIAWWMLGAALATGCADDGSGGADGGGGAASCPADLPASCPADAAGYKATIAPLIAERCGVCHTPGGASTPYLETYAEISAAAGAVLDQVYACKMPPAGYPKLTPAERQELLGWLVCKAPDD
jgi:uncharacterized membrane protein